MIATTRKLLLLSISALSVFAFAPVISHGSSVLSGFASDAEARGGGDDHGGDSSGGGNGGGGGRGRGGSDDGASHDSGDDHGGGRHSGDDDSASHHSSGDDSGHRGRNRGNDDDDVANSSDDDSRDDNGGGRRNRPSVEISVTDASLQGLLNGSLRAVDNLGRTLEVEVENEHGTQVVIGKVHRSDARRIPGAITSISIVSAN